MDVIARIAEIALSWPACSLWFALLFRSAIAEAVGRLRVVNCPG